MSSNFKVGDKVYLKAEEKEKQKRIWTVTSISNNGVLWLERVIQRKNVSFQFLESAKSDEIVLTS